MSLIRSICRSGSAIPPLRRTFVTRNGGTTICFFRLVRFTRGLFQAAEFNHVIRGGNGGARSKGPQLLQVGPGLFDIAASSAAGRRVRRHQGMIAQLIDQRGTPSVPVYALARLFRKYSSLFSAGRGT